MLRNVQEGSVRLTAPKSNPIPEQPSANPRLVPLFCVTPQSGWVVSENPRGIPLH
jgi:hypothetical protein